MSTIENISVSSLLAAECSVIADAFTRQDWSKPLEQFQQYLREQAAGSRVVLIANVRKEFAGYVSIVWTSNYAVFREHSMPEIQDFNVLKKYQRRGVGTRLMDAAESLIAERSDFAGIRVGLTADYAVAHRLYIKRGYLLDGNGISYRDEVLKYGDE